MIVVAESAYFELIDELHTNEDVILIPESRFLYDGIRDHSDLHCLGINSELLISQDVQDVFTTRLKTNELEYRVIGRKLGCSYPETALLNAALLDDCLICNPKTVAPEVLELAEKHKKKLVSTKQGYTRCTTLPLVDACITDDPGVYKSLKAHEIGVLKVEHGYVELAEHDYGFIGGCAGVVGDTVYFNGDVKNHPDWVRIKAFCEQQRLRIWRVAGKPLRDVGSILWYPLVSD